MFCVDTPGAPGIPKITDMTNTEVTLSWSAPSDDGGSPITGYVIESRIEGGFKWQCANEHEGVTGTRYTVGHLHEGTQYEFRVAAQNKAGTGLYSECGMPVVVQEPITGDPPRIIGDVSDVIVISPEVATLECDVRPGTKQVEIRWYVNVTVMCPGMSYTYLSCDNIAAYIEGMVSSNMDLIFSHQVQRHKGSLPRQEI